MPRVLIQPAEYNKIDFAIELAFKQFPFDLKGKKVLIKPNVLRASNPNEGIVTNPAVLRAVVNKVESMEPSAIVVGDNPGVYSYGANEDSFKTTGLLEASMGYYKNIGKDLKNVSFNKDFVPHLGISEAVLDADFIISLPKFKTHGLTVMSGAIKNSYGIIPGAQKANLHRIAGNAERFHDLIVEVFRIRVPDFFIVDAVTGMEGNGPASPDLRDIGVILASDNAVAVDAVIATMMGIDPGKLRFLQKAKAAGLGDFNIDSIEIIGELKKIPKFQLPPLGGELVLSNDTLQNAMHARTMVRPKADPNLCVSCGICIEHCPVSALSMIENLPVADANKCIACFCCQEICPAKAITLT
jgi:uncharacterized protein (DUF362 family)/NAD-dependent dihydropyrimidine dehydrogenase PreA subunit